MDSRTFESNAMAGIGNFSGAHSKRGTPNKCQKAEYDNFLISMRVEQVNKSLKCDKTFKKPAFVYAANAINGRFNTDFTSKNVENHY